MSELIVSFTILFGTVLLLIAAVYFALSIRNKKLAN
jgi:cbb3-type cytochrome oxidase subunit 3